MNLGIDLNSEEPLTEKEIESLRTLSLFIEPLLANSVEEAKTIKATHGEDIDQAVLKTVEQLKAVMTLHNQKTLPKEIVEPYLFYNRIISANVFDTDKIQDQENFKWQSDFISKLVVELKKLL